MINFRMYEVSGWKGTICLVQCCLIINSKYFSLISRKMAQDISQLLECKICAEPFDELERKPKILPCHHTLCLQCMRQMAFCPDNRRHRSSSQRKIKCPNDNKEFDIPSNDPANFPNDLTMMSLLDVAASGGRRVPDVTSESTRDDIKKVLERRVKILRRETISLTNNIKKSPIYCHQQIEEAREAINISCRELKEKFIEAVDTSHSTLIAELDAFALERKKERDEKAEQQLQEVGLFCEEIKTGINGLSDKNAIRHLDRCVKMIETTKSIFRKLESPENNKYEVKFKSSDEAKLQESIKDVIINTTGELILRELTYEITGSESRAQSLNVGLRGKKATTRSLSSPNELLDTESPFFELRRQGRRQGDFLKAVRTMLSWEDEWPGS